MPIPLIPTDIQLIQEIFASSREFHVPFERLSIEEVREFFEGLDPDKVREFFERLHSDKIHEYCQEIRELYDKTYEQVEQVKEELFEKTRERLIRILKEWILHEVVYIGGTITTGVPVLSGRVVVTTPGA